LSRRYAFHAAYARLATGDAGRALEDARRVREIWPDYLPGIYAYFAGSIYSGEETDARAALAVARRPPMSFTREKRDLWLRFLQARDYGDAAERAETASYIEREHETGEISASIAVAMLSQLGQLDQAFQIAGDNYAGAWTYDDLFMPATRNLRADPRFMSLAADLGLVDVWSRSDTWPDFCSDRTLPYDCRALATSLDSRSSRTAARRRT